MCNSTTTLCTSCIAPSAKWQECEAFKTFKTQTGKTDMSPAANEWITKHTSASPSAVTNKITLTTCISCRSVNKARTDGAVLAAAVEKATATLFGTFLIVNALNKTIAGPWTKAKRVPHSTSADADEDADTTETETEGDDETETELDTDNDTEGRLRVASK